jgi:hypothetical protein
VMVTDVLRPIWSPAVYTDSPHSTVSSSSKKHSRIPARRIALLVLGVAFLCRTHNKADAHLFRSRKNPPLVVPRAAVAFAPTRLITGRSRLCESSLSAAKQP